MNPTTVIHLLGSAGLFPSRAFLPAFCTALLLRFPGLFGLDDSPLLALIDPAQAPTWFTHDITLWILGLLSLAEIAATKSAEIRSVLQELDRFSKPAMAFLTSMAILKASDAELVRHIQQAGIGDWILPCFIAGVVYSLAQLRYLVLDLLREADESDTLGLQGLLSWVEDLWAACGLLLLFLYPLLLLFVAAAFFGALFLFRKYMAHREEQSRIPCGKCGEKSLPTACACFACGERLPHPRGLGFFGQASNLPTADSDAHPFELAEHSRCPVCATRLKERSLLQRCEVCGREPVFDTAFALAYAGRVERRLPRVLGFSFLLGLIPVLGMIPALIYYRFSLVAPFRNHLSMASGCLVKWAVRLLVFLLILLQVIPLLGALSVPLMAYLEYLAYRRIYLRAALSKD